MGITTTSCSLTGRETEIRALDGLLSAGRHHFVAVLLRGDAGVGKAALSAVASDRAEAEGARVFAASGVRSEVPVAFAGLHHMLRALLRRTYGLTRSHRDALLTRFEMGENSLLGTDLIALATLELQAEEAGKTPLVLVAEDAHWLDCSTADVLGLTARRLDPGEVHAERLPVQMDKAVQNIELKDRRAVAKEPNVLALVMTRGAPERSQGLPVRIAIEEKLGAGIPAANSLPFGFGGPPGRTSWL